MLNYIMLWLMHKWEWLPEFENTSGLKYEYTNEVTKLLNICAWPKENALFSMIIIGAYYL